MNSQWIIMTAQQTADIALLNGPDVAIDPRAIDGVGPGVASNLNDGADGLGFGDDVPLVGRYVVPRRIVDDPEYTERAGPMVAQLLALPFAQLDSEVIFLPASPDV